MLCTTVYMVKHAYLSINIMTGLVRVVMTWVSQCVYDGGRAKLYHHLHSMTKAVVIICHTTPEGTH
jgi:hypothetical protein